MDMDMEVRGPAGTGWAAVKRVARDLTTSGQEAVPGLAVAISRSSGAAPAT